MHFRWITTFAFMFVVSGLNAQDWGTLKGKVVWGGSETPKPELVKIDKDQDHCLSKGDITSEKLVIDPATKGVRWVMVWLVDPKNPKADLPIHPSLKEPKEKEVLVDQPCCKFEPHLITLREGQTLVAKNSSPIPHNVNLVSTGKNPSKNEIIPPGRQVKVDSWVAASSPTLINCDIHPWMMGYIRVFNHPYFAVTDDKGGFEIPNAPVGSYNLVVWQEEVGWVTGDRKGIPVIIKATGSEAIEITLKLTK